jgi:PAS domain S-box-containing protein
VQNRKIQLVFGSAILLFLVVGFVSYRTMVMSVESDRWFCHTHEVLESLQSLVFDLTTIESSGRGFVLTGDEFYLQAFRSGISNAKQHETSIRNLTQDNPKQQRQLPVLEDLMARNILLGNTVIALRRAKGLEAAASASKGAAGQQMMIDFREVVRGMREEEQQLLAQRRAHTKQLMLETKTALFIGTTLGLLLAAAAGWTLDRDTAGRELAKALLASEERYGLLLDGIQDHAIFMMDPHGQIVSWNKGAERIKGYKADQIIGRSFSCFFPPGDINRGRPDEILRMTAATGRHEEIGMRVRRDGSSFLASVTFTALRDRAGHLQGFSEFSHDLSGYRGLLEAAPDAMVVVNEAGEMMLLNLQTEKQFGYSRDELIGRRVTDIIPEGFAERLIADGTRSAAEALAQQIETGIELIGRRKDGSEFPIEIMLSPLDSAEGILVTAAIRDITKRKKSEEHLVNTVAELKRSNDELQQFAYVASHDLQEPLRMVASYTELLASRYEGKLDSDADEFIAFAVDGCNRMQGLIQDLLLYSRAGTNGKLLNEVAGDDALKEALANLQITIKQSSAVVTYDSLPTLLTDEAQLTQVFQNLIGNAIKYHGPETPRVHISAAKNGNNEWIFSVRDNGLGIEAKYFDRIFILFQRLHGRDEFAGTGIGLSVCKKILERLGGRIWVESQPEQGSTFKFTLPQMGASL